MIVILSVRLIVSRELSPVELSSRRPNGVGYAELPMWRSMNSWSLERLNLLISLMGPWGHNPDNPSTPETISHSADRIQMRR